MGRFCHLIMVNGDGNNNKYYQMTEKNGAIEVEYGRVDSTKSYKTYPLNKWDSIVKSKLKKGYKDVTDLIATKVDVFENKKRFISDDKDVQDLFDQLEKWAKDTISQNYKVNSNKVTRKMIDEAQELINRLSISFAENKNYIELNKILTEIYMVIPRRMNNVRDYLLKDNDKEHIKEVIDDEQKLLDTMSGQVMANDTDNNNECEVVNVLENLGIRIKMVSDNNVIKNIKKMMGETANLIGKVFEVTNITTETKYDKIFKSDDTSQELLLWHGSRNQNWFNILQTGLLIRPSGAVYTGSMFGDACYFANKARKSIGYSSLSGSYWARGNESKSFIALFKVNVGKQKHVYKHTSECYSFNENNIKPYNSVYAHGGIDLRNDEFMIYNPNRCTIKYLVEINKN